MTNDGVYWVFTASAQTVAAFVALLLAGYALVVAMLDSAASRDETLVEINESLKKEHHRQLRDLSRLTALTIITDLGIVVVQGCRIAYWNWLLLGIGLLLNAVAILLAVRFIIGAVDPDRIGKTAKSLLKTTRLASADTTASVGEFVAAFGAIEQRVRALGIDFGLANERAGQEGYVPLKPLVRWLVAREVLDGDLARRLDKLARYRNLVVHGHVDSVEVAMLQEARSIESALEAVRQPPSR